MSIKIKWNCSKPFFSVSVLSFTISTYDLQSFNLQRGNAGVRKTCAQANRSQYPPPSARETMLLGEYWQVQVSPRVSATVELCSAKRLLYAIGGWSWAITRTLRQGYRNSQVPDWYVERQAVLLSKIAPSYKSERHDLVEYQSIAKFPRTRCRSIYSLATDRLPREPANLIICSNQEPTADC